MIRKELSIRKDYLEAEPVETIYFGGGTPSLLDPAEVDGILETIRREYKAENPAEVTLEANPEDLTAEKIAEYKRSGVNRLSIGVQTFNDQALDFLNRKHSAADSRKAIELAISKEIENINIDLIYSIPFGDGSFLEKDLKTIASLPVQHVSAYSLTIEEKTFFGHMAKKGKIKTPEDELSAFQFISVVKGLREAGFEQYEISNFARDERYSKHNSSYWLGGKYLGAGPGAHSYNLSSRQFNIPNNPRYIASLKKGEVPATMETLTWKEKMNDYILTGLRTKWGISLSGIRDITASVPKEFREKLEGFLMKGLIKQNKEQFILTDEGKLLADEICMNLFLT